MHAIGFDVQSEGGIVSGELRTILTLRLLPKDFSRLKCLPEDVLRDLRSKRDDIATQLEKVSGVPDIATIVRKLRDIHSIDIVVTALETLHSILSNVLSSPMDHKYRRVRVENKIFQNTIGKINDPSTVMAAIAFVPEYEDHALTEVKRVIAYKFHTLNDNIHDDRNLRGKLCLNKLY